MGVVDAAHCGVPVSAARGVPVTRFLASVRSLAEARIARDAGADIIDLKEPGRGSLGAMDTTGIRAIVEELGGRAVLSATIGDMTFAGAETPAAVRAVARTGVDIIKAGVFGDPGDAGTVPGLVRELAENQRLVLVLFAEQYTAPDFDALARAGVSGVMLDTMRKDSGPITRILPGARLSDFVVRARTAGLMSGLAGSLRERDIPALRAIRPDYLGFRGALCRDGQRTAALEADLVARIRSLVVDYPAMAQAV